MSKATANNNATANNSKKQIVKAVATAKQTADSKKQFDLSAINAKIAEQTANKKQTADSKKQNSKQTADSKKQNSKKQTATADSKKQNSLSAYKTACRNVASLADLASDTDKALVKQIREAVQHDDFIVVCKDTTSCALFIVDNNKNTVCNVYDCLRIQFTTVQVRKYRDALLADSKKRFYTHLYKNNEFISCKCKDFESFVSAMQFVYTVYMNSKQTATATEQTAEQQIAK